MISPPESSRRRWTSEDEIRVSSRVRQIEMRVFSLLEKIPEVADILSHRSKRKELTSSRHVDRIQEAVQRVQLLRPRPVSAMEILGLWHEAEKRRWELAMSGYRIAVGEARKMSGRGLDMEDLINEGVIGLVDAAKRFDPARKLRFSTYARWWVRARMLRAIDTTGMTVRLPGGLLERLRRLEMIKAMLERAEGGWSVEQLAAEIGLSVEEVRQIFAANDETQVVPLSAPPPGQESDARSLEEMLACDRILSPEVACEYSRMNDVLREAVSTLLPHHQQAIGPYLGLDSEQNGNQIWTLQSAADQIGVSRERMRQILLIVKAKVASLLSEPKSLPAPESPIEPSLVMSALGSGAFSAASIARQIYGSSASKPHVEAIEDALICLERDGKVVCDTRERRTIWRSVA